MITIKPLGTRVIIRKEQAEEKTQSGIILTGMSKRVPIYGEVVAVGPGTEDEEMFLEPGNKVVYPNISSKDIMVDDVEYSVYEQKDILAIIEINDDEYTNNESTGE